MEMRRLSESPGAFGNAVRAFPTLGKADRRSTAGWSERDELKEMENPKMNPAASGDAPSPSFCPQSGTRNIAPTMHDTPLDFSGAPLSHQKEVVRRFYQDMWNRADTSLVPGIFHPDFTFRGSLGPTLVGHQQFIGYVESVTAALGSYTCDILALVEEGSQVLGKLRFHGFHRKDLLGVAPTGRHVWWYGAPVFTFEHGLVRDLWVLGDVHGLLQLLRGES